MINEPVRTAINDATFTLIEVPVSTRRSQPITFYEKDGLAFEIAYNLTGTNPAPVPALGALSYDAVATRDGRAAYAKMVSGTGTLITLIGGV